MQVTDEESISESSCSTASEQFISKAKAKQARKNERERLQRAQETEEQREERLRKRREAEAAKRATLEGESSRARRNETLRRRRAEETEEQRAERLEKRRRKKVCVSTEEPVQTSDYIERVAQFASATREFHHCFTENPFASVCCVRNRLWHKRDLQTEPNVPNRRLKNAAAMDGIATLKERPNTYKKHSAKSKGTSTCSPMRGRSTQTEICIKTNRVTQTARLMLGQATQT